MANHQPEQLRRLRAKSSADAQLAGTLHHGIRSDGIDPRRGQQQGNASHNPGEQSHKASLPASGLKVFGHELQVINGQILIERGDFPANEWQQCLCAQFGLQSEGHVRANGERIQQVDLAANLIG